MENKRSPNQKRGQKTWSKKVVREIRKKTSSFLNYLPPSLSYASKIRIFIVENTNAISQLDLKLFSYLLHVPKPGVVGGRVTSAVN